MRYTWLLLALVLVCNSAQADSFTLDFDALAPGPYDGNTGITVVDPLTGITVELTRPGSVFEIAPTSPEMTGFGTQTLSPFIDVGTPDVFVLAIANTASHVVGRISFDVGDFDGSDIDLYSVTTYDLGFEEKTSNGLLEPAAPFGFTSETQSVERTDGISFMTFTGGSDPFYNSLFWDNFVFTTFSVAEAAALSDLPQSDFTGGGGSFVVGASGQHPTQPIPEPGTLASIGAGLAAWFLVRRRRGA